MDYKDFRDYRDYRDFMADKRKEKHHETRMVIKWIFFLTMAIVIYFALKFLNEREITIPQVGEHLATTTVETAAKAIEGGRDVSTDTVEKGTVITKDILTKSIDFTKKMIAKNIEEKNSPARPKTVVPTQPETKDQEPEQRKYKYPLF